MKLLFQAAMLLLALLPLTTGAGNEAAVKQRVNLPPSVHLSYSIKARQNGIPVEGSAAVKWSAGEKKFSVHSEVRAMVVGKILDAKSEGIVDNYGLAPLQFVEKRFRKDRVTTVFDRSKGTIIFSKTRQTSRLKGGEQDHGSAVWQLLSIARTAPEKFKVGTEWHMVVAGPRDTEPWTFQVISREKIKTGVGELATLHITRKTPSDAKDQQLDIWLAPALEWYPVRLRYEEDNGDFIEQKLQATRKLS